MAALGGQGLGGSHPAHTLPSIVSRERTQGPGVGVLPRKESSYASTTASKVSIAPFSLETLEHILDHFAPASSSTPHVGFAPDPTTAGAPPGYGRATSPAAAPNGRASSPPGVPAALRHSMVGAHAAAAAIHAGHPHGGRASTAPGVPRAGVLKDSAGAGVGAAGQGPSRGRVGLLRQASSGALGPVVLAHGALPGIPPGATPPELSSRAAAVLQEPESAAHLQRFIPLDSLQLQNHFVINSPNGQLLTNLGDIACDGAASIDGLPPVVREVVVLTTAPDGVPVPRVLPVDAPGPNSLRRTGATTLTSTSGPFTLSQSSSRLSLVIPASPRTSNGHLAAQDGLAVSDWGETPTGMPSVRSYGNLSCRRSDNGMLSSSRTSVPSGTTQLHGPLSPSTTAPSSPGAAGCAQSARAVPPQSAHGSHQTSSYSVLPVLGDGACGAGSPSGRARLVGPRHGSGSRSRSVEVHTSQSGLPQLRMADGGDSGAGGTGALPSPGRGSVRSSVWGPQDHDQGPGQQAGDGGEGDFGAGGEGDDAGSEKPEAVSPTRARLMGRMDHLLLERSRAGPAGAGAGPAAAMAGGVGSQSRNARRSALTALRGMDLVKVAIKQVERSERTMAEAAATAGVGLGGGEADGSRPGTAQQIGSGGGGGGGGGGGAAESEEVVAARQATEARQAKLVKSLTRLFTLGRHAGRTTSFHASRLADTPTIGLSTPSTPPRPASPPSRQSPRQRQSIAASPPSATTSLSAAVPPPTALPALPPHTPHTPSHAPCSFTALLDVALDPDLDPHHLLRLVQRLDALNEEFKLVEAARERARRLEAMSAPSASDSPALAKRKEGATPASVAQVIASMEAPLDRPMEVDLEGLLAQVGEALDSEGARAAELRYEDAFRNRTERYLAQLARYNPAAFEENHAAQAEADYRSGVERAKLRLRQLQGEVAGEPLTSASKPRNQYDKAVAMLQAQRPFFLPPVMPREAVERAPVPCPAGAGAAGAGAGRVRAAPRPAWDVHHSVFRERKKGDARDVYDNAGVLAAQFNLDWSRIASKMLFVKLVAREDQGVRGTGGRLALEQELAEIRKELSDMFPIIRSAFTYYSIATTEEVYAAAAATAAAAAAAAGRDPAAAEAEVADFATAAATDPWKWRRMAGGSRSAAASRSTSPIATSRPRSSSVVQASPTTAAAASPPSRQATAGAAAGVPVVAGGGATATATAAAVQQGGVPLPPMEQPPALAALAATVADSVSGMLEMDEQRWLAFCCAAGVTGREPGVRVGDLRLLFWAVNREEERNMTLESKANNDFALMRFEFMEALVRLAFGRYVAPGTVTDGSDATRLLLQHLRAALPQQVVVDPNVFRRTRLYTADMEVAVVQHLELITATFKLYKARDRSKYLAADHWVAFLEANGLLAQHFGLNLTEARLLFAWSQMVVVDELKLRRRAVGLQLFDFVEALARLSERLSLPASEDLDLWLLYNLNIGRNTPLAPASTRMWEYCSALAAGRGGPGLARRDSGNALQAAPSRPLAAKFRALMEYLQGSLADAWGGSSAHDTAQCMLRTANLISGGVELA